MKKAGIQPYVLCILAVILLVGVVACKGSSSDSSDGGGPVTPPTQGEDLMISPSMVSDGEVNLPYLVTVSASGGFTPYTFTGVSGMPPGLVVNGAGTFGGIPTQAGIYSPVIRVTDAMGDSKTISYQMQIVASGMLPMLDQTSLPRATVNSAYFFPLTASGGVGPYTFSDDGGLPPNLTMSADGVISGLAAAVGTFPVVVSVEDSLGAMSMSTIPVVVGASHLGPQVITPTLPNATLGVPYAENLVATGGTSPYLWSTNDQLPAGLSLMANGQIAGTPSMAGIYNFTVIVVDSANTLTTANITLTVN